MKGPTEGASALYELVGMHNLFVWNALPAHVSRRHNHACMIDRPLRCMAVRCALVLVCLAGAALARPSHSPARQQEELQKLFSAIDTDSDQEISAAEAASFAASLDSPQESWSPQEVRGRDAAETRRFAVLLAGTTSRTAATRSSSRLLQMHPWPLHCVSRLVQGNVAVPHAFTPPFLSWATPCRLPLSG